MIKSKTLYEKIYNKVSGIVIDNHEHQSISLIIFKHFIKDDMSLFLNTEVEEPNNILLQEIFDRLSKDEPIQYILEETYFLDLKLYVNKNVLIPRPETEEMLLDAFQYNFNNKNILDIGTGSGCIALSLKKQFMEANVHAIDVDCNALVVAQKNAKENNLDINFIQKDILQMNNLEKKYDLIISNPPYVCNKEKNGMSKRVKDFEPKIALFVEDTEPLIFYKKIIQLAEKSLKQGGMLFFEINEKYGNEIAQIMCNFDHVMVHKDMNNKDRWISAKY